MQQLNSSFRDPDGYLFWENNKLYRAIQESYSSDYEQLMTSGLYAELTKKKWLVSHIETDTLLVKNAYKVIDPQHIPFISYPYEWSFSQLKDAALLTLKVQRLAFKHGMMLKDASAYNVQFLEGKPIFIDTLSFERYRENEPWGAYRQFCCHFLAPLAIMSYTDVRLGQLLRNHIDGIPLDLAVKLLPWRTRLRFSLLMHLHWHAKSQPTAPTKTTAKQVKGSFGRNAFTELIHSLESAVKGLSWTMKRTEWGQYYTEGILSKAYLEDKKQAVREVLTTIQPKYIWDLGANDASFSRIATDLGAFAIAFDVDVAAVEQAYLAIKENKERQILPLLLDLTNPSPAIGWHNEERDNLWQRPLPDTVLALALVHHLAISNNLPLDKIAAFLASLAPNLIIEFVPKKDPRVQQLLAFRKDIFVGYTMENFEFIFQKYFKLVKKIPLKNSDRTLYCFEKKRGN